MVSEKTKDKLFKLAHTAWIIACAAVALWVLTQPGGVQAWVAFLLIKFFAEAAVRVWGKKR